MLLNKEDSLLLLVDVQEKLIPAIANKDAVVARCEWLLSLAIQMSIPILASEQYPKGLGHTIASLRECLTQEQFIEKVHFSCLGDPNFLQKLEGSHKKQIILIGIEAHVCVLQSAMELQEAGFAVYVVVDAVGSRNELDLKYGLKRMKQQGIHLITAEMVFFEWVRKAGTPEFKTLSKEFLQ